MAAPASSLLFVVRRGRTLSQSFETSFRVLPDSTMDAQFRNHVHFPREIATTVTIVVSKDDWPRIRRGGLAELS